MQKLTKIIVKQIIYLNLFLLLAVVQSVINSASLPETVGHLHLCKDLARVSAADEADQNHGNHHVVKVVLQYVESAFYESQQELQNKLNQVRLSKESFKV